MSPKFSKESMTIDQAFKQQHIEINNLHDDVNNDDQCVSLVLFVLCESPDWSFDLNTRTDGQT